MGYYILDLSKKDGILGLIIKMPKELLFSLTKKDFEIQTFRSGGKGGQNQNKVVVFVYLVRLGFTNKPIKVLPEDVRVVPMEGFPIPFRKNKKVEWDKRSKDELRQIMSTVLRDAKGRWLK